MVYTRDSFISGIAMRFYDNIDILTIRYFLDDAAVGVYGIGFRFALPVQVVSGAIADAMLPEVSSEAAEDNDHQVTSLVTDAFVYAPIIALPATVGVAILAEPLVVTAFSGAFADSALIAVVAIGIQIPAGFRSVFSSALNAVDRPDVPARAGFTVIVANLLLDVILVPTIGPLGAVIASLAAIGIATIYLGYHVFSIFDLAITDLPLREFGIEIAAALFMGGAVYGLQEMLSLPNIPLLAITITTGAGVYFAAIMILSESIRQRLLGIADDVLPVDLSNNK
jgi:O-antigen/teichoic acid export membrane protein